MIFRPFGILGARRPERSLRRTIRWRAPRPAELGNARQSQGSGLAT
jgi:hypothetical protein